MVLSRFCCCFDLRRGCIIYAWLQMIITTISTVYVITYKDQLMWYYQHDEYNFYEKFSIFAVLLITFDIIKGFSCIPLIWGLIKKNHMFYQPWILLMILEILIYTTLAVAYLFINVFTILAFGIAPIIIIISVIKWYYWACVYTVYRKDMNLSFIKYDEEDTNNCTPPSNLMLDV